MRLDKIEKALELMQSGMIERHELEEGGALYFVPSWSDPGHTYTVSVSEAVASCDCEARVVCCHMLASVGRAVAVFCWMVRRCEDLEDLDLIVETLRERIAELQESFRQIARSELQLAQERLRTPKTKAA
jgi:hypothetical protein